MGKLTEEEIRSIQHFWYDKGDLKRMSDFEELMPKIEAEYPEVLRAIKEAGIWEKVADTMVEKMGDD